MRRAPRGTARLLSLAVAGALLFVVGYFAGSRHAADPLQGLTLALLPEPQPLAAPDGVELRAGWQLLLVGDTNSADCRDRLAWLTRVHNRQAGDAPERIGILLVSPEEPSRPAATPVPGLVTIALPRAAANRLARQLGAPAPVGPDCRGAAPALVDPQGRLVALLPADAEPAVIARDLERVLAHHRQ